MRACRGGVDEHPPGRPLRPGLPDVRPCVSLYRLLLERGRPQPGRVIDATTAADLVAWLPEDLRPDAAALLSSGHRLVQEWVGYQALRDR
ncbi:MAG: hypothetical protein ACRDYA_20280 [Egibacteraceae bacterium]